MNCHVFVDFDGTIVTEDTTDLLLTRFADPEWEAIEEAWKSGEIGSRECMVRQIDLLRATPESIDAALRTVTIDAAFRDFVAQCERYGFPLTVVSDGLDRNIATILAAAGLSLPFYANRLEWLGDDRWRLSFPNSSSSCSVLSGTCKCRVTEISERPLNVMIGDGRSDFCVAGRVDMVLSKGDLSRHCEENSIPHVAFKDFAEAGDLITAWLTAQDCRQPVAPVIQGDK